MGPSAGTRSWCGVPAGDQHNVAGRKHLARFPIDPAAPALAGRGLGPPFHGAGVQQRCGASSGHDHVVPFGVDLRLAVPGAPQRDDRAAPDPPQFRQG
jgi:hypothetical protein